MLMNNIGVSGTRADTVSVPVPASEQARAIDTKALSCGKAFPYLVLAAWLACNPAWAQTGLRITGITDNRLEFPGQTIPRYEKLEITFQVEGSVAQNLQFPYDPAPPPGIRPDTGINVDALFTTDNWVTVWTQPAFHYQEFLDEIRSGQEWFYPTENYSWRVRFSPHQVGRWQYKLRVQDASGTIESGVYAFSVTASSNHGFLRASRRDPRYFEFEDGKYFPALGYNMNYDHVSWRNPVLDNQQNFQIMGANGIQLARIWLSQWSIYGSEWNPWNSQDPAEHGDYMPATGITFENAYPGSDVSMRVAADQNRCMFIGLWKARPAVRRNTNYRIRIRYMTRNMGGPVDPGRAYGFLAKTGDWLWSDSESQRCYAPGTGSPVTPYQNANTGGWQTLEGSLNSGASDFLPNFFLVMENVSQGEAFVDHVAIEESLGGGMFGPNIASKPWMAHHLYFEQRNSFAFDKLLELARMNDVYLKAVILEKNDRIVNHIDYSGNYDPVARNEYFYGNWRQVTKVRWLQKAWWRYLQARWGYSTNIQAWELLNEGDPFNGLHYTLADEFGRFMHQFRPNDHLVSTSTWNSFPVSSFWGNASFPNIDFADVHQYVPRGADYSIRIDDSYYALGSASQYYDTAAATANLSLLIGAGQHSGAAKPTVRGETGFVLSGSEPGDPALLADTEGIWLHNFVWGMINQGGLIESYWYEKDHIYGRPSDRVDLRPVFRGFYQFMKDIPLNNGSYRDAAATASDARIRAWGQKDLSGGRAHLWIQNTGHTWKAAVDKLPITPVSATISMSGFSPGANYPVEWWDPYSGVPTGSGSLTADSRGNLSLGITGLVTDKAVRIGLYSQFSSAPAPPKNLKVQPATP